jgi:hypothetical protein
MIAHIIPRPTIEKTSFDFSNWTVGTINWLPNIASVWTLEATGYPIIVDNQFKNFECLTPHGWIRNLQPKTILPEIIYETTQAYSLLENTSKYLYHIFIRTYDHKLKLATFALIRRTFIEEQKSFKTHLIIADKKLRDHAVIHWKNSKYWTEKRFKQMTQDSQTRRNEKLQELTSNNIFNPEHKK